MENYLKYIVAIVVVTITTFGINSNVNAKIKETINCNSTGKCGTSSSGENIEGQC